MKYKYKYILNDSIKIIEYSTNDSKWDGRKLYCKYENGEIILKTPNNFKVNVENEKYLENIEGICECGRRAEKDDFSCSRWPSCLNKTFYP